MNSRVCTPQGLELEATVRLVFQNPEPNMVSTREMSWIVTESETGAQSFDATSRGMTSSTTVSRLIDFSRESGLPSIDFQRSCKQSYSATMLALSTAGLCVDPAQIEIDDVDLAGVHPVHFELIFGLIVGVKLAVLVAKKKDNMCG